MDMLKPYIEMLDLTKYLSDAALIAGLTLADLAVAVAAVAVALLALFSRYGYTVMNKVFCFVGAIAFALVGTEILVPQFLAGIALPMGISIAAVVGLVLAAIGGFIMCRVNKLGLFLTGAILGYLIVPSMIPAGIIPAAIPAIVIDIVAAVLVGLVLRFFFKPLFILISSLVGMIGAAAILGVALFGPAMDPIFFIVFAVIGLVVGIINAKKQFADAKK